MSVIEKLTQMIFKVQSMQVYSVHRNADAGKSDLNVFTQEGASQCAPNSVFFLSERPREPQ
jgi:hypothetical protein